MDEVTQAGKGMTKWHIVKNGAHRSICGSGIYTSLVRAACVPVAYRCKNTACRANWPDYRDVSDNTVMRQGSTSDAASNP